ncbi:MAG: family 1 glycosylhydrolase, partial [Acholeplasmataceae bacterium]
FKWGAATASAQIEGGYKAADRTPSVWDVASNYKYSNLIFNNHTSHVTCDHYNRVEEDVKLMKEIGLTAYRFSISWTRLIPNGVGKVSEEGLKFYNKLIDELIKNDIIPYITIFHWDYPQSLLEQGGWLNPESTKWFEEYATKCVELFSDRVTNFMTMNEPECFINLGYIAKRQAPYYDLPMEVVFKIQHNVLLANGLAINSMRKHAKQDIKIGVAFAQGGYIPVSDKEEDIKAAYDAFFDNSGDEFWGNWFVNTILTGKYDERKLQRFGDSISYKTKVRFYRCEPIHRFTRKNGK